MQSFSHKFQVCHWQHFHVADFTCIEKSASNPSSWLRQWALWEQPSIASEVPLPVHFFLTRRVGLVHPRTWPLFSLPTGSLYTIWSTQEGTLKQQHEPAGKNTTRKDQGPSWKINDDYDSMWDSRLNARWTVFSNSTISAILPTTKQYWTNIKMSRDDAVSVGEHRGLPEQS